ncbi:hypothetical protein EB796_016436 [Bugula neritina]|uniref:Uncharacterized protein n=1 Tax=Bugula neritina TaxID=10212 RepID=A0A7J7JIS4_BUGNE|nr:hypothetical protein EB796_016436 [Bugula neritina]
MEKSERGCDVGISHHNGDNLNFPLPPPPSYNEIFSGVQPAQGSFSTQSHPIYTYVDFCPDGPNSKYPELIEKANSWLSVNRSYLLLSCESVTLPVQKGNICRQQSVHWLALNNGRDWVTILRCWIKRVQGQIPEQSQVIKTLAHMPEKKKSLSITISNNRYGMGFRGYNPEMPSFSDESQSLKKLNENLANSPLPGKILRVESIKKKVTDSRSMITNLDPDTLYWTEGELVTTCFVYYTRILYLEGEPTNQQIGWKDFIPTMMLNPGNPQAPKFASFPDTFYKVSQWVQSQQDKRVTNIQSMEARVMMDPPFPQINSRPVVHSHLNQMAYSRMLSFMYGNKKAMFLRVYYVLEEGASAQAPQCLLSRTFAPYRLTPQTYENPVENVMRLDRWVNYNEAILPFSEKNILCAESVTIPTNLYSKLPLDEGSMSHNVSANQFVSGIRLYLNGACQEPPLQVIGCPPPVVFTQESSCCTIL